LNLFKLYFDMIYAHELYCEHNIKLNNKALSLLGQIKDDKEHDVNHTLDVIKNIQRIFEFGGQEVQAVNEDVCIIGAHWHDVGRLYCGPGHEKKSAEMLKEEMEMQGYKPEYITECYRAIVHHKHSMVPETLEGHAVKDADKLGFLGLGRWKACIDAGQTLDSIMDILPNLEGYLHYEVSRELYKQDMIELVRFLHKRVLNEKT